VLCKARSAIPSRSIRYGGGGNAGGKQMVAAMAAHEGGKHLRKPVMCFSPLWVLTLDPSYT